VSSFDFRTLADAQPNVSEPMSDQKVARPSRSDVLRVAARDFPSDRALEALRVLGSCAIGEDEGIRNRIHAAVLKLAGGDIERLRQLSGMAKADFRDVIAPAEYPRYLNASNSAGLSAPEQRAIFDADWAEYHAWLSA
jgi:hypothetical protein